MQNEFEKKLQQEMEIFSLEPADNVWQMVEARIKEEKKKRRVFLLWFFIAAFITVGGAFTYYSSSTGNMEETLEATKPNADNNKLKTSTLSLPVSPKVRKEESAENKAEQEKINNPIASSAAALTSKKNFIDNTRKTRFAKTEIRGYDQPVLPSEAGSKKIIRASNIETSSDARTTTNNQKALDVLEKKEESILENPQDTVVTQPIVKQLERPFNAADTVNHINATEAQKVKINKRAWRFGVAAGVGLSEIKKQEMQTRIIMQNSSPLGVGSAFANRVYEPNFTQGISFNAGVFGERSVHDKIRLSIGLHYSYQSVQSKVGTAKDSAFVLFDPSLDVSFSGSRYYNAGATNNYRSAFHSFQAPVNVLLQLNKNKLRPIHAFIGVTPSVLFKSNGLYVPSNSNLLISDSKQFKSFQLFTQAGFLFPIKQNIQVGPIIKYSLTDLHKPAIQQHQRLLLFGLEGKFFFKIK